MPKRENLESSARQILVEARRRAEESRAMEWFAELTGREIYEEKTVSLVNRKIIDRPVRMALTGTTFTINGEAKTISLNPVDVMTDSLVDGYAVVRLGPGWEYLSPVQFDTISEISVDGLGQISFLRFQYIVETASGDRYFRRDYFVRLIYDERGRPVGKRSYYQDWELVRKIGDFNKIQPGEEIEIAFIPFVVFPWRKFESFYEAIKKAILQVENVTTEISGENLKHSKRKLFVKLPTGTDVEIEDLGDNINKLTAEGDAFYPDPHSSAMDSFFKEKDGIVEAIEDATGVIATEKIVALSGVSRMFAMRSLIDFGKEIRNIFTLGMVRIESIFNEYGAGPKQKLLINYQPIAMAVADPVNQYELLTQALEANDINEHEKREAVRMMLSL